MKLSIITARVNDLLAGEMLSPNELLPFMDEVIEEINENLDSCFPTMTQFVNHEYEGEHDEYDFFPERYIRTVLIKGTAYKFYVMDEEGTQTAQQYQYNYIDALFKMQRDYLEDVPEEYRAKHQSSVVGLSDVAWKRSGSLFPMQEKDFPSVIDDQDHQRYRVFPLSDDAFTFGDGEYGRCLL